jgi:hypothetical protein
MNKLLKKKFYKIGPGRRLRPLPRPRRPPRHPQLDRPSPERRAKNRQRRLDDGVVERRRTGDGGRRIQKVDVAAGRDVRVGRWKLN